MVALLTLAADGSLSRLDVSMATKRIRGAADCDGLFAALRASIVHKENYRDFRVAGPLRFDALPPSKACYLLFYAAGSLPHNLLMRVREENKIHAAGSSSAAATDTSDFFPVMCFSDAVLVCVDLELPGEGDVPAEPVNLLRAALCNFPEDLAESVAAQLRDHTRLAPQYIPDAALHLPARREFVKEPSPPPPSSGSERKARKTSDSSHRTKNSTGSRSGAGIGGTANGSNVDAFAQFVAVIENRLELEPYD